MSWLQNPSTRRRFLWLTPLALGGLAVIAARIRSHGPLPSSDTGAEVTVIQFDDRGRKLGAARGPKVVRTDEEWLKLLTPEQFYVARRAQTDPPYSGTYYRIHDRGLFRCRCCASALFSSDAKYDSGTGWPSFWAPIALENVRGAGGGSLLSGIEVLCRACDAHLGHIFDDGPAPAHLRYCINESSLRFLPA